MPSGDSTQAGADVGPILEGDRGRMTMLAEVVDAVIGIDTHRDSHEVEIADAAGKTIATMRIGNDSGGFAQLLAAIAEVAPGAPGGGLGRGQP
jgi:hypothetical protein